MVLIDERTRIRLVWVVWIMCMIGIFHLQDEIVVVVIGLSAIVFGVWVGRRAQAAAKAADARRAALAARADEQHAQVLEGDPRGTYGEHVVTWINGNRYVCELCGQAGSERWAILHQYPIQEGTP